MTGVRDSERALYPRLLGPRWDELCAAVRGLHLDGEHLSAVGTFAVRLPLIGALLGYEGAMRREGSR